MMNSIYKWLNKTNGSKQIGEVKAHRGKIHDYLGMVLDFSEQVVLQVLMKDYISTLLNKNVKLVSIKEISLESRVI
jgi:hypothetical protein